MAKFSDAFLQGLRGGGRRGSPTDPMLQRQAGPQYGSSDPLAKSIGGMFGMDMRTAPELTQEAMGAIKEPVGSSEHLKKVLLAKAKYAPPQEQMLIFAKLAEIKKADDLKTEQSGSSASNRASVAAIVRAEHPELADAVISEEGTGRTNALEAALEITSSSAKGGTTKGKQFDAWDTYIDSKGNTFNVGVVSDPNTGKSKRVMVPVGDVETPVGTLSLQEITTKAQTELNKTRANEFAKLSVAATAQLPELESSFKQVDAALTLLDTVTTGGPINAAGTALEAFLGETSAEKAQLQVLLGEAMFQRLKPLFGGMISEGEREAVKAIYADIKKGKGANTGALRYMGNVLKKAYGVAQLVRSSSDFNDYNTKLDSLYPDELLFESETKKKTPLVWTAS